MGTSDVTGSSEMILSAHHLRSGGWSKAKSALDTVSGVSRWWLHDLRRTFATGLQRLGVRLEVTEAVLNHLSGSRAGVVGIYQRHDWAEETSCKSASSPTVRRRPSHRPKLQTFGKAAARTAGRRDVWHCACPVPSVGLDTVGRRLSQG